MQLILKSNNRFSAFALTTQLLARTFVCTNFVARSFSSFGMSKPNIDAVKITETTRFKTIQLGLTGSIGMGKSTISNHFRKLGFPVFDADLEVHRLYSEGGEAVPLLNEVFPDVIVGNAVDRNKLMSKVIEDPTSLRIIEGIVHPLVISERERFYRVACEQGKLMVVFDIPLLFENIAKYSSVDYIVVATAAAEVQKSRVLARPGMTEEKFLSILAKQVPDHEKRTKADFLVHTDYSCGYAESRAQIATIIETIIKKNDVLWEQWKTGGGSINRSPRNCKF
jgi:dephospho-CoA kinase